MHSLLTPLQFNHIDVFNTDRRRTLSPAPILEFPGLTIRNSLSICEHCPNPPPNVTQGVGVQPGLGRHFTPNFLSANCKVMTLSAKIMGYLNNVLILTSHYLLVSSFLVSVKVGVGVGDGEGVRVGVGVGLSHDPGISVGVTVGEKSYVNVIIRPLLRYVHCVYT